MIRKSSDPLIPGYSHLFIGPRMHLYCSGHPGFLRLYNPSKELITRNFLPGSLGISNLLSRFFGVHDLLYDRMLIIRGLGSSGSVTSLGR